MLSKKNTFKTSSSFRNSVNNISTRLRKSLKRIKNKENEYHRGFSTRSKNNIKKNPNKSTNFSIKKIKTKTKIRKNSKKNNKLKNTKPELKNTTTIDGILENNSKVLVEIKKKFKDKNVSSNNKKTLIDIVEEKSLNDDYDKTTDIFIKTKYENFEIGKEKKNFKSFENENEEKILSRKLLESLQKQNDLREENFGLRENILKFKSDLNSKDSIIDKLKKENILNKENFLNLDRKKIILENNNHLFKKENENLKLKYKLSENFQLQENRNVQNLRKKILETQQEKLNLKNKFELKNKNEKVYKNLYLEEQDKNKQLENTVFKLKSKEIDLVNIIERLQDQLDLLKKENDQTWQMLIS